MDNRKFRRLAYQVLERNPTREDIQALFERFKAALDERGLRVRGVTTDGSELYPEPIAKVFPGARHQLCKFHVLKEIVSSVLDSPHIKPRNKLVNFLVSEPEHDEMRRTAKELGLTLSSIASPPLGSPESGRWYRPSRGATIHPL